MKTTCFFFVSQNTQTSPDLLCKNIINPIIRLYSELWECGPSFSLVSLRLKYIYGFYLSLFLYLFSIFIFFIIQSNYTANFQQLYFFLANKYLGCVIKSLINKLISVCCHCQFAVWSVLCYKSISNWRINISFDYTNQELSSVVHQFWGYTAASFISRWYSYPLVPLYPVNTQ